jgi:hypothetical protein
MSYPERCPACDADFQGPPINPEYQHYYGKATHYSRVIALTPLERDVATHWKCPDCGHVWTRI